MKKRNLFKILIIVVGFLIAAPGYSQNNFAYKATLGEPTETKFYKIDLPPQVIANCKAGLEDIRIFDENGKPVSYILKNDLPAFKKENLTEFPIIKNLRERDKQTHVILENTTDKPVKSLLLFIKNTEAQRAFSVSGSDDSIHWFIIKENIYLDNSFKSDGENIIQTLSFLPAKYRYFQLTILGENLLPFDIVKAGIYNEDIIYGKYVKIPAPAISQNDSSNKKSYVLLNFDNKYQINKLIVEVDGGKYFRRKVSLFESNKNGDDLLLNGYLGSDSTNSFIVNSKNQQLLLIINNEDNVPLKVTAVNAFQINTCLLTYLEAGKKYFLGFGDSTLPAPEYDLRFFSDSVEKNPLELSVNTITKNKISNTENKSSPPGNNHLLLWAIVSLIFFVLCFFTFKMMREVNKKADKNQ